MAVLMLIVVCAAAVLLSFPRCSAWRNTVIRLTDDRNKCTFWLGSLFFLSVWLLVAGYVSRLCCYKSLGGCCNATMTWQCVVSTQTRKQEVL